MICNYEYVFRGMDFCNKRLQCGNNFPYGQIKSMKICCKTCFSRTFQELVMYSDDFKTWLESGLLINADFFQFDC